MKNIRQVAIPTLVRVKPGAVARVGLYCKRYAFARVSVFYSEGLPQTLLDRLTTGLKQENIETLQSGPVLEASMEGVQVLFKNLPTRTQA
ncbi:MAG TPA: dehydrogenase, partial [Clostridia bacterium]|nr:dehydrogenase [Clostridia bacterium]